MAAPRRVANHDTNADAYTNMKMLKINMLHILFDVLFAYDVETFDVEMFICSAYNNNYEKKMS